MKCKKVISAGLALAFVMGISGCNSKKGTKDLEIILSDYNEALNELDAGAVRSLSDWKKKDADYKNIGDLFDLSYLDEIGGDKAVACAEYIASTIEINYDTEDLSIKGDDASVKVVYELVDWEDCYYDDLHETYDEVLKELKSSRKTISVKGKVSFEKEDGEWKLCQLSKLNDVFSFVYALPEVASPVIIEPDPTKTPETTPGTSPAGTDPISEVVEAAVYHLQAREASIRAVQHTFGENACGVYDIDSDGIPELYYLASDNVREEQVYTADLHICEYNEYAGEYVDYIVVPNIIYMAADGGSFAVFTTGTEIIVLHGGGEESFYHIETEIYDLNWSPADRYRRDVYYEYDPEYDIDTYTYEYFLNEKPITEAEYNLKIKDYIDRTTVVIERNYMPLISDVEYPLLGKPMIGMIGYDESLKYLESLK